MGKIKVDELEERVINSGIQISSDVTFASGKDLTLPATHSLTNGVTATTQSSGNNSTKVATTAYVDTAVASAGGASLGLVIALSG